ncbi:hypothetical protein AB0K16_21955 [Nonomuraea jabiensis]|uniref:hypothetical protein n=1 Tax=Nonomuraea jabiensis TaxID=882448 RepID=UPI00343151BD
MYLHKARARAKIDTRRFRAEVILHHIGGEPIVMPAEDLCDTLEQARSWVEEVFDHQVHGEVPRTCLAGWVHFGQPVVDGDKLVLEPEDAMNHWKYAAHDGRLLWTEELSYTRRIHPPDDPLKWSQV